MGIKQEPWSWRSEPSVPEFEDTGPVLFVDGACGLCSLWARLVCRYDRAGHLKICPVQSDLGRAMLTHFGLDPDNPDSWLFIEDGCAFVEMPGIAAAAHHLGGWPGWLGRMATLPPRPLQKWLYARMARNRYAIFGRTNICALPDPDLKERLIG